MATLQRVILSEDHEQRINIKTCIELFVIRMFRMSTSTRFISRASIFEHQRKMIIDTGKYPRNSLVY